MSSSDTDTPKIRKSYLTGEEVSGFEAWDLPNVGLADSRPTSDLFGFSDRADRPEPEPEDMMPPTMAELEQIRAEAEQEGFAEGQQRGYDEGLEKGHAEGLENGFKRGFDEGKQQGFDEGMQRSTEVLTKLESAMAQLQKPLALLDTEVEMELIRLAMQLAQAVVMTELKTHPEHVLIALRQGVDALPIKQQAVSIRVHPEDARRVGEAYSHSQLERQGWEIEVDPTLHEGDCIVQTQRSAVDMRLTERLSKVLSMPEQQLQQLQRDHDAQSAAIDTGEEQQSEALQVSSAEVEQNGANDSRTQESGEHGDEQSQTPVTE